MVITSLQQLIFSLLSFKYWSAAIGRGRAGQRFPPAVIWTNIYAPLLPRTPQALNRSSNYIYFMLGSDAVSQLPSPRAPALFTGHALGDTSCPRLMEFCEQIWCLAPDTSPASNKTPDQARPNYSAVAALLPQKRRRDCKDSRTTWTSRKLSASPVYPRKKQQPRQKQTFIPLVWLVFIQV